MALVKLCNTVNRIGVSLFSHTELFVKVINQLESKKKKKKKKRFALPKYRLKIYFV